MIFLFFTHTDGKNPIPPTIIHQGSEMSKLFRKKFPNDQIANCTLSGYMDRKGWFKTMYNFINLCGASKGNSNFIFFNGHHSHWNPDAININFINFICNFFLKTGESEKNQPNNNGPNFCPKVLYNKMKEIWCEKYGMTTFTSPHILISIWSSLFNH